ncbi:phosphate ABC transporter permease PstA [Natronogracilivirga saccharolytica]|uniref:Phosphate transport system permease protein PstA n=1 Tax=Natronogracilivirga saccharolytica TaxID=2812953 RepID=A0A8J7RHW2_9BACT|nr:phosphate ABC transporter permease PstA [Natronogracilivirga saccharolytica]MBP3191497.1 phosphate ABC transporter permease PstA [Natronogracilivirga saccharolytica]
MRTLLQRNIRDRIMESLLVLSTIIVLLPLVIIIIHVVVNGISALNWEFFTEELGSPSRAIQGRPTGLVHTIIGTLVVDFMALIIAVPIGIGAGIMLSEYPDHKLNPTLRIMNDTLNGMPAILKGLLAFVLIVKPMGTFSGLAGGVALAFVMLPIIARTTESSLMAIPWSIREAGLAIGLPRWRVVLSTVMPAAKFGLVTGTLIAFARAAGEAAPLLFTSFGNNYLPNHWFGFILNPVDTLPQRLYSLAISPYTHWHSMGWAAAIVLLVFVILCFAAARFITRKKTT